MVLVLLGRLGRTPTFVVPIINPPFADYSRQLAFTSAYKWIKQSGFLSLENRWHQK